MNLKLNDRYRIEDIIYNFLIFHLFYICTLNNYTQIILIISNKAEVRSESFENKEFTSRMFTRLPFKEQLSRSNSSC